MLEIINSFEKVTGKKVVYKIGQRRPHKINDEINVDEVRLVGDNIEIGIYPLQKALSRSNELELDLGLITSTAASNFQGGVAKNTRESIFLCESAGYDIIIIETVGVGQNEISVSEMVDFFLLLKIAGSGDELQGIKRGIIEMSDLIAINKSDGDNVENSEKSKNEFQLALKLFSIKSSEWTPKVLTCSSLNGKGLNKIWNSIEDYVKLTKKNNYFYQNRINQNKFWLKQIINESIQRSFYENNAVKIEFENQLKKIEHGETSVFEATQTILSTQ